MGRIPLEKLLIQRKFADDINDARALIESGKVLVNGAIQTSPASAIDSSSAIEFLKEKSKYISRGGFKLEKALNDFNIDVAEKRCLDIGSSTGGFTDCLLQRGAREIVAIDVGTGQLDISLRNDGRVKVFEKTNAKNITPELINGKCNLAVMDVSFTSIIPLLNPIKNCLDEPQLIVLIKPQFEVEQKYVNKNGIVTDQQAHVDCIEKIQNQIEGWKIVDLIVSPLKGAKGNTEYLALFIDDEQGRASIDSSKINETVKGAFN